MGKGRLNCKRLCHRLFQAAGIVAANARGKANELQGYELKNHKRDLRRLIRHTGEIWKFQLCFWPKSVHPGQSYGFEADLDYRSWLRGARLQTCPRGRTIHAAGRAPEYQKSTRGLCACWLFCCSARQRTHLSDGPMAKDGPSDRASCKTCAQVTVEG